MGYETSYSLTVESKDSELSEIFKALEEIDGANYALDLHGPCQDYRCRTPCKWYSHDQDMLKLSKKFPEARFLLEGEGEEQGDVWKHYYRGGRVQRLKAIVTFPEYDPTWKNSQGL